MANGRPIGTNTAPVRYPTEGTNSYGRESQITKSESPTRVDLVNDNLIYIGWADAGVADSDAVWKIRKLQKTGSIWIFRYANGNEFFRNKWSDRSTLNYL